MQSGSKTRKALCNLALCFAVFLIGSVANAVLVDRILAIVNDQIVTLSDLNEFKRNLKSGGMFDDRFLLEMTREDVLASDAKALDVLINQKITDVEIKQNGLEATVEKTEQEIRSIAKRNGLSREQLMAALVSQGMDTENYVQFIKKGIERQTLLEREILSKIKITEDDIATYFSRNSKLGVKKIFEYKIAHILFDPNVKKGAKERATKALKRLQEGENFETLVSRISEEKSPAKDGLLGSFKSGEFSKEFEDAVSDLDVGGYSQVIKSRSGFHIIRLLNRKLITDPAYEKEKRQAEVILQQQEFRRMFKNWLEQKRQELFVKKN